MLDEDVYSGVQEVTLQTLEGTEDGSGLVLKWRSNGDMWEGLVSHEVEGKVRTEWVPFLLMAPAPAPAVVDQDAHSLESASTE